MNLTVGGCSGELWPHSSLREYILFSKAVLGGPMIIPVQFFRSISSSFSSPQLMVPSPTPFWPASSSSSNRKLRGITAPPAVVAILPPLGCPGLKAVAEQWWALLLGRAHQTQNRRNPEGSSFLSSLVEVNQAIK